MNSPIALTRRAVDFELDGKKLVALDLKWATQDGSIIGIVDGKKQQVAAAVVITPKPDPAGKAKVRVWMASGFLPPKDVDVPPGGIPIAVEGHGFLTVASLSGEDDVDAEYHERTVVNG